MVKVSEDSAAKFINALIKSVQTLCHGYLEFSNGIQIIGHINLSVDEGTSLDYILKEKVCKNAENSTLFISNSFHAEPKSEPEVSGKNPVNQRTPENQEESGRVGSAISSISSALTSSREKRKTGTKDSDNLHSHQNSGKRKASDDADHRPPKVTSHHDNSSASQSPYHSQSSPLETKEALRSKLRTASEMDMAESETLLPQTAGISGDSAADIGVNLAGSVLEPVDDQGGDLPGRDDDSDGDLEVTFIKEEFVEGERSACEYGNTGPFIGSHQRASEGMTDPSLYPVSLHSSSTYVPSAHDFQPGPSTSQSGSSSMRDQSAQAAENLSAWSMARSGIPAGQELPNIGRFTGTSRQQLAQQMMHASSFSGRPALGHVDMDHPSFPTPSSSSTTQLIKSDALRIGGKRRGRKKEVDNGVLFSCQSCDATFKTNSGLLYHERQNHKDLPQYRCSVCNKGFVSRGHYVGHMNMHNNTKTFSCPICFKTFAYMSSLKFHLKMHNNETVYECPVCFKKFNYEKSFKSHFNTHNKANAFSCPQCPKKFAYRSSLLHHLKSHD